MLRTPDDVHPEQTVYLYPQSKMAGRWCWMQKEAVVVDAKSRWPMVHVKVTHEGQEYDAYPSRDDIRIRPVAKVKQDRGEGDTAQGDRQHVTSSRKKAAFAPHKPADLAPGQEQGTLF